MYSRLIPLLAAVVVATAATRGAQTTDDPAVKKQLEAFNTTMVEAFKRDPASVAALYTDDALIVGGGRRAQGREAVREYWKGASMFTGWTLETLHTGGTAAAPWQYGRSVVSSQGRTMETFFLGLYRRLPSGELRMQVDAYSRDRKTIGAAEAARVTEAWSKAAGGDAALLKRILEDPFSILAAAGASAGGTQDNSTVLESVARTVADRYLFPDVAQKIVAHIRERARQGAYDNLTGAALADALTRDLRVQNGDRHLYVQYQPGQQSAGGGGTPVRQSPGASAGNADLIRRRNYFLNRAERLDGNIGYLEVRRFFGSSDEARDAIAGAMAFLARTDALIVDVRYAPGGDARMVDLIASYFFDKVVPTLATYSRGRNEVFQRSTLESVPGRRRPDIPVFVLTSRDTGSAAEDFAFLMRQTGRATLVGDRTAGAGHTNAIFGIGGGFTLSVSIGRTYDPKTNEGWEGTGVQPHVRAAPASAVETAHRLALTELIEKATDPSVRRELAWTRDALDARLRPPSVDAATLQSYAGLYGSRQITFEHGRLWYQRAPDAEKIPLTALSSTEFAMGEGQRFQFAGKGDALEMRMLMTDGSHVAHVRQRR